ncbi:MAG: 3-hydroxybutyryl-CoA dehydrogenase [Chloroflexi bacterium]|nr:3-hydroxybutyryl-CoA dehydrogenase [Chloroflexota bacterium]
MDLTNIKVEITDGVALVTLQHPPLNTLTTRMLDEIYDGFARWVDDPAVRVVVFKGEGERGFSAGADVGEFFNVENPFAKAADDFRTIENFPKPVIAAIHGYCLGGGCEFALSSHLRIVADNAVFGLTEVKLGIIPGWGGTQRLARLVGKTRALDLLLSARRITAAEALNIGLVNRVVPLAELVPTTLALAKELATGAPVAQRAILHAVLRGADMPFAQGLEIETEGVEMVWETEDALEGFTAFKEKRPPKFVGR